jgi:pyruvate dehydrogenase E1 component beta subunit
VVFIDDRWLYQEEGAVPEGIYEVPIGKAIIRRPGKDITLVAVSFMAQEAMKASSELAQQDIDVEFIDVRTAKPIDMHLILRSVRKTGRLVVADGGWKTCGWAAEVAALVSENTFASLKAPIGRVTLPDCPAPASAVLEKEFYKGSRDIAAKVIEILNFTG